MVIFNNNVNLVFSLCNDEKGKFCDFNEQKISKEDNFVDFWGGEQNR
ncbi:MAG: hypothetical protein ACJA0X_002310 [Cyclobacteriaceae bacterium]|jgi:hypothetical protein